MQNPQEFTDEMRKQARAIVSEDGTYTIPVEWSVYSTITVEGAKNYEEAIDIALEKLEDIPCSVESECIEESYNIALDDINDIESGHRYNRMESPTITKNTDGSITIT